MPKLNQVLAIERNVKSRTTAELTEIYKVAQKPSLFDGMNRHYTPKDENQEQQPSERQLVQQRVDDLLRKLSSNNTEIYDVTFTKDAANQNARADLVIDGKVLAKDVPAVYLLYLEKQITDLGTVIEKIPVLDPAFRWFRDEALGLWQAEPVQTSRTKKVQKSLVLLAPTEKHPGQAQLVVEDEVVGQWAMTKQSGAMRQADKDAMLDRLRRLQKAIKFAREQANTVEAPERTIGGNIFDYLLAR